MATSTYPATGGFVDNTSAATFIPELWSDEVNAAYKSRLVMAPLVKSMPMGEEGDTIRVPAPSRGQAYAKVENQAVTVQNNVESEVVINIDKHYEFSRKIEDITKVQAKDSLRAFYTDDAGYGLAKQVDTDLMYLGTGLGDGTYAGPDSATEASWTHSNCWFNDASNGKTVYAADTVANADIIDDAFIRNMIQELDDEDTPDTERFWVVPPALKNTLLGIDRFNSADFTGRQGVETGLFGEVYGVKVYTSTNCPTIVTAANNTAATVDIRASIMGHKDAFVHAEQMAIRSQTQYKQEWLGWLYTSDCIYGVKTYRPESAIVMAVPNIVG